MTTLTTNHLSLSRRTRARLWLAQRDPWSLVVPFGLALVALIAALALAGRLTLVQQPAAAQPTLAPIILIATARAEARPTPALPTVAEAKAAPLGHVLARAVVAYDSPSGHVIGAIDSGRSYTILERYGADWLHADVSGSGVVWLATADLFDLPQGLADMQPSATPQIVTVPGAPVYVSVPAAPVEPLYQVDSASEGDALGPPPTPDPNWTRAQDQSYRQQIGLTDADVDQALADHQRQQAASCDAGKIANATYCDAVRQWLEAHQ